MPVCKVRVKLGIWDLLDLPNQPNIATVFLNTVWQGNCGGILVSGCVV